MNIYNTCGLKAPWGWPKWSKTVSKTGLLASVRAVASIKKNAYPVLAMGEPRWGLNYFECCSRWEFVRLQVFFPWKTRRCSTAGNPFLSLIFFFKFAIVSLGLTSTNMVSWDMTSRRMFKGFPKMTENKRQLKLTSNLLKASVMYRRPLVLFHLSFSWNARKFSIFGVFYSLINMCTICIRILNLSEILQTLLFRLQNTQFCPPKCQPLRAGKFASMSKKDMQECKIN